MSITIIFEDWYFFVAELRSNVQNRVLKVFNISVHLKERPMSQKEKKKKNDLSSWICFTLMTDVEFSLRGWTPC